MRRGVALLLVWFGLFSGAHAFGQAVSDDDQLYVVSMRPPAAHMELRTLPSSTIGQPVTEVHSGTKLNVLHRERDGWWYVRVVETGKEGWANRGAGDQVKIECCATTADTSDKAETPYSPGAGGASEAIPMRQLGGTYVVPVVVNNTIKLDFVVDSGAADVSIPADVVSTLLRTHTIDKLDFIDEQSYVLADGSKASSVRFRIRSLKVGNNVINNVTASLVPSEGGLLLGQSFLRRFRSWSINNTKHELVLNACCQPGAAIALAAAPIVASQSKLPDFSPPLPPIKRTVGDGRLQELSMKFIFSLYREMSSSNKRASAMLANIYADAVNYFGKVSPQAQVIEQEKKFMSRWPIRQYKPKNGSVFVDCNNSSLVCSVNGVLQFDKRSPEKHQRSIGEATFQYHLQFSSTNDNKPKVILENGLVRKQTVSDLSPIAALLSIFR